MAEHTAAAEHQVMTSATAATGILDAHLEHLRLDRTQAGTDHPMLDRFTTRWSAERVTGSAPAVR